MKEGQNKLETIQKALYPEHKHIKNTKQVVLRWKTGHKWSSRSKQDYKIKA